MSLTGAKFIWQVVIAIGLIALLQIENASDMSGGNRHWANGPRRPGPISTFVRAAMGVAKSRGAQVLDQLRESMEGDELAGLNPYAQIGLDDLLKRISPGIVGFGRQTLRSPDYQEEFGYDLIHYEIRHSNGPSSKIQAFVENGEVVVSVLTPKGDRMEYSKYRAGMLEETAEMEREHGEALLAQHLDSGIPFLSLAR